METANPEEPPILNWEQRWGKVKDEKGIAETIPDFIVGDINKMKELENTTLRQIAQPYTFPLSYDEVRDLCRLRWKFEHDSKYFSMSMPQIGIPKRGIVYYKPTKLKKIEPKDKYPIYVLLNPTYEPDPEPLTNDPDDQEFLLSYEKCASVKGVCGLVTRYNHIKFKGFNPYGQLVEETAFGNVSRYIQHEIDHLNGLLFTDQAHKLYTLKEMRWRVKHGKIQMVLDVPGKGGYL